MAGVAFAHGGDIDVPCAWQAWDLVTSTIVLRGMSDLLTCLMETLAKDSGNILACLQRRLVRAMRSYVLLQAMFDSCLAASGMSYFLQLLQKNRCVFMPYARANELVVSDLPNSFPSHLSLSPILPVRD